MDARHQLITSVVLIHNQIVVLTSNIVLKKICHPVRVVDYLLLLQVSLVYPTQQLLIIHAFLIRKLVMLLVQDSLEI